MQNNYILPSAAVFRPAGQADKLRAFILKEQVDPSYGTDILEVEGFSVVKVTDSLYRFDIKPVKSADETLFVHVRSLK